MPAVAVRTRVGVVVDGFTIPRLVATTLRVLGQLVEFGAVLAFAYLFDRIVLEPVIERVLGVAGVEVTIRRSIQQFVRLGTIVAGFAVAFTAAEFGNVVEATGPIIAALTLAIGFASRDIVSNLVSGVFIVADPSFRIGDWIEFDDTSGVIEDITFRVTRVRTFDNETITVPNSKLATNAVTNAVERNTLRITTDFHVGYDDDVESVTDILLAAARAHDEILDEPEPTVRVTEVDDSRVGVQARVWIADPNRADFMRVRSEYLEAVRKRFHEAGVSMPPRW